jgi:hypothetical protein
VRGPGSEFIKDKVGTSEAADDGYFLTRKSTTFFRRPSQVGERGIEIVFFSQWQTTQVQYLLVGGGGGG